MLLTIIITILACSTVVTLINVIGANTKCSEENVMIISCGPIGWLFVCILNLVAFISTKTKHLRYKSMLVCPDGKIRYCDYNLYDEYRELEGYSYVDEKRFKSEGWNNKDWKPIYRFLDVASTRYAPKKVWKNYEKIK